MEIAATATSKRFEEVLRKPLLACRHKRDRVVCHIGVKGFQKQLLKASGTIGKGADESVVPMDVKGRDRAETSSSTLFSMGGAEKRRRTVAEITSGTPYLWGASNPGKLNRRSTLCIAICLSAVFSILISTLIRISCLIQKGHWVEGSLIA